MNEIIRQNAVSLQQSLGELDTSNAPSRVLDAISTIHSAIPTVLNWINEERSREGKTTDEVIARSGELGEEVRRMNEEELRNSTL